ncbi:PhoD-like phosphatase-domain-containing protein [Peziza echinospora]|nr:PhoD-like phosphatase-domain-containing protein [Peziza echinospora]
MIPLLASTPITALSAFILKAASYIFLRWIPSHIFIKPVFTSYLIYLTTFLAGWRFQPKYDVLSKTLDVKRVEIDGNNTSDLNAPVTLNENAEPEGNEATPLFEIEKPVQRIEATETVVKRKIRPNKLKSLLLGTPAPNSRGLNLLNLLLHTLLASFVADLTYRSEYFHPAQDLSFARTGYVSENSARILIREPDELKLPLYVYHRPEPEDSNVKYQWIQSPPIRRLTPVTDFTVPVEIHELHPSTKYAYRTSNGHAGSFRTAPARLSALDKAMGHHARNTKFTFLTSSCIKARFPYNPFHHPLHMRGFKILGQMLRDKIVVPDFMLFLGDFIYIDVPHRPKVSKTKSITEGYREHYRQVYASPDWADVNIPWIHVVDDHEIANDWSENTTGIYPYAMEPFYIYQHSVNPPSVHKGVTYYQFIHGTASFFLADTRQYRSGNFDPDGPEKSMLGKQQRDDVISWLRKEEPGVQWKIFVSSVPFTKNWRFGSEDTWAGFLYERRVLLEEMWRVGAEGRGGVVVLSGDRHEFGATAFPPPADSPAHEHRLAATVHEFSCSPMSQFYLPKRTYVQNDDEDVLVKYIPDGNSKVGAVEVDSTNVAGEQAVLKYRLFVDGKEVWDWVVTADMSGRRVRGGVEGEGEKEGGRGLWD